MASSIVFNDGAAATLTNAKPTPADRFASWRNFSPSDNESAQVDVALGTGVITRWAFRQDFLASFELRHIPMASLGVLERLKYHLEGGGTATLNTGDSASRTYTVRLAPGTEIEYEQMDAKMLEYVARFVVKNASAAALICIY